VAVAWAGPWPDDMAPPHATVAPRPYIKREAEVAPYGIFETIKDAVVNMLEAGVAIKEKVQQVTDRVNAIIDDIQEFYDDFMEANEGKTPSEAILDVIYQKLHDEIMDLLDVVFDEIDAVFYQVADFVDDTVSGVWGEATVRKGIASVMESIYSKYIDIMLGTLRKAIGLIDFIDHEVWESFVEKLMDSIEEKLNAKLHEYGERLRNSPAFKRSLVMRSEELTPYGFLDTIKDAVNGMIETGVNIKEKIAELTETLNEIIRSLREFYEDYTNQEGKTPTEAFLEHVIEKLHDDIVKALDVVFDQIDIVFHSVADYVDETLEDVWGKELIRKGVNSLLESLYSKYIDAVLGVLRIAIDAIDFIEHESWDMFVDRLMDSIEESLDERLDEFGEKLKNKAKRSLVSRSTEDVTTMGIIDSIKDTAQGMLDAVISVKDKIADMGKQVVDALTKVAEWYKEVTADKDGKPVTDVILEELFDKIVSEIGSVIEKIFDEIADAVLKVAEYIDEILRGIWEEAYIREKIAAFLDYIMETYVAAIMNALQKILDAIDFIENNDWEATADGVVDIIESIMHEKLDELSEKIKERLGLLDSRHQLSVAHIDRMGIFDNIKEYVKNMVEASISLNQRFESMHGKLKQSLRKISAWYEQSSSSSSNTEGLVDELLERLIDEISNCVIELVDDIADIFLDIADFLDEKLKGAIEESAIKERVSDILDAIIKDYLDRIIYFLNGVLSLIDFVKIYDWEETIEEILYIIRFKMNERLEDIRDKVRERLHCPTY